MLGTGKGEDLRCILHFACAPTSIRDKLARSIAQITFGPHDIFFAFFKRVPTSRAVLGREHVRDLVIYAFPSAADLEHHQTKRRPLKIASWDSG